MKYGYPDIISALYPGAEFNTHTDPDRDTIARVTAEGKIYFSMADNFIVEWLDKTVPCPTAADIREGVAEAEALIDAARAEEEQEGGN